MKLARFLRSGDLTEVQIPDAETEAMRICASPRRREKCGACRAPPADQVLAAARSEVPGKNVARITSICLQWHMSHYAYLLDKMKKTPEGAGTLLDNSAVIFMPEAGHGVQLNDTASPIAAWPGGLIVDGNVMSPRPPERVAEEAWFSLPHVDAAAGGADRGALSQQTTAATRVARNRITCYTEFMRRSTRSTGTRSFRIDPKLVAAARRASGARDDTEAVRIALAELVERAKFSAWVRKVAGRGRMENHDG